MKYLLFLAIKSQGKKARGFTLIELLVVVIILGVLAAVGLPNLLRQVSKGRQAEAIAILGQINRAQQAYRYEKGIFAMLDELTISGINNAKFYTFSDYFPPTDLQSSYQAEALPRFGDEIKNYAGGVRLNPEDVGQRIFLVICEAKSPLIDNVFVNNNGGCSSDSIQLQSPPMQLNPN